MSFGRSNSLSIDTSATKQLPATGGGLFGSLNAPKPAGTSLFGQPTATTTATTGSSLFGTAGATSQPAATGGLFGTSTAQPTQTGGLFGSTATTQPAQSGGLFGSTTTAQPAQTGGLFGSTTNTGTSLFGKPAPPKANGSSLFGGSLFGAPNATAQPAASGSLFGASANNATPQQAQAPSLLSASRYNIGQPAPYTGRLTMGEGNAAQTTAAPATKLDWANVKPVTRYADLVESAKEQLEYIDKMIQQQEAFSRQIEAFLPVHNKNLSSLQPDIDLVKEKTESVEQALVRDAQGIQQAKQLTQKDNQDILRCERIGENLRLPAQYHYAPAANVYGARQNASAKDAVMDEEFDVNVVSNYFVPMSSEMQKLFEAYSSNLSEIESHLSTIEATAVAQAQSVIGQRSGAPDPVRQLADTLHDFEGTILATAAKVGAARDSVTSLSLGRSNSLRA